MHGQNDSSQLEALVASCGVSVKDLYSKYSSKKANVASCDKPPASSSLSNVSRRQLDKLNICSHCNALGLVQVSYNFQNRDVNCDRCDGEGVISK